MTAADLRRWMRVQDYDDTRLAAELEIDRSTVYRWRMGVYPITEIVGLALDQLEMINADVRASRAF